MKKIVSLLMIVAMLLTATTAFAAFSETVSTGMQVSAVEDSTGLVTVTVTANTSTNVQGVTLYLLLNGVIAVNAANNTVEASDYSDAIVVDSGLASQTWAPAKGSYTSGSVFKAQVGGTSAVACNNQTLFVAYFRKTGSTLANNAFAYGTTTATTSKISYAGGTQVQTKTAGDQQYFGLSITPYEEPAPADDFVNDTTSAVAKDPEDSSVNVITCAGRVGAEHLSKRYGVEFTADSTVGGNRPQVFYGAKPGDTVSDGAGGTKTFVFDGWDGTFEIILQGVHAGTKNFRFFVGSDYTDLSSKVVSE